MNKFMVGLLILIIGCAHGMSSSGAASHFSVNMPEGWRQLNTDKYFLITKDGAFLQYALVQERSIHKAFKHTKKKLKKGMLPQEAADVILAEIGSDKNISNFELIENHPNTIDGHEGFKILFTYKDEDGSAFKTLYYGFVNDETFYNLRYTAAQRYYFERDLLTFEKFVDSFMLIEANEN
jgi:hypothetical protein